MLDNRLIATAMRDVWQQGYRFADLRRDAAAGLTVGIVAIPLAMALAIASGVPPQHGLYTAIIAGIVIALAGGSRVNVSGPTAAFVVILLPVTQQFGLGGLLLATILSGLILIAMGMARMGKLIRYIPYPVTTGFTAGIAVVIALLQIRDFLGLQIERPTGHFSEKIMAIFTALPTVQFADLAIALLTLAVLIYWPRLKLKMPGHLVALVVATLAALAGGQWFDGFQVESIGSRFHYMVDGISGDGIPPMAPHWLWPWQLAGADGQPLDISLQLIRELIGPAFAIAMLAAIESLLCAVVADGLTAGRHNPNSELIGQGLGNVVAPFFGGITATAAIARTATNIRAGARSPVASVIHSLTILLAVLLFAELLAYVPMAALAAFLMVVAWNMSEARHFVHIVRVAPKSDVLVLLTCFGLTVVFDMVIAVAVGLVLASMLFIKRMSELTGTIALDGEERHRHRQLPDHMAAYDINGPLFFGAAETAMSVLQKIRSDIEVVIIDMEDVPMIDMTGLVALESLLGKLEKNGVLVVLTGLSQQLADALSKGGIAKKEGSLLVCRNIDAAISEALKLRPGRVAMAAASK